MKQSETQLIKAQLGKPLALLHKFDEGSAGFRTVFVSGRSGTTTAIVDCDRPLKGEGASDNNGSTPFVNGNIANGTCAVSTTIIFHEINLLSE